VHPSLPHCLLSIADSLEATWRRIPVRAGQSASCAPRYVNRTLHADVTRALEIRELMRAGLVGDRPLVRGRIRDGVEYSAKLGRYSRRDVADGADLFTVLPPSGRALPRGLDRDSATRAS
jgi:hypothetical protein